MHKRYDTIYYWSGGEWHEATPASNLATHCPSIDPIAYTVFQVQRMGYVARHGRTSIGPPDSAPSAKEIRSARARKVLRAALGYWGLTTLRA